VPTTASPGPPLAGVRVIELAGIGPGPFAGMMLADMGAEVICVERPGGNPWAASGNQVLYRSRRSIAVDLKTSDGVEVVRRLCSGADALMETFRPGVAERLGVGPDDCLARNPALVYGRMTGWGQEGPLAQAPGHDINYIALSGALHAVGRRGEQAVPPLNLVGDFGGGGMLLAFGMVTGIVAARATGRGRVVDAAMIDGSSALMAMFHGLRSEGLFGPDRGTHMLDSGAFFYDVYDTKDGLPVSVGAIETQFWAEFCDVLGLDDDVRESQMDASRWPELKERLATVIAGHTRAELDDLFAGRNTCYAPVLSLDEVEAHPHHRARGTFLNLDGVLHTAPAPRFDGAPPTTPTPRRLPGQDTGDVLADVGFGEDEVSALLESGAVAQA